MSSEKTLYSVDSISSQPRQIFNMVRRIFEDRRMVELDKGLAITLNLASCRSIFVTQSGRPRKDPIAPESLRRFPWVVL